MVHVRGGVHCTRNWSSPSRQQLPEAAAAASARGRAREGARARGDRERSLPAAARIILSLLASLLYTFAEADCLIRRTDDSILLCYYFVDAAFYRVLK